jgi:dTDP-4-amino-4,6-dideoxygalactose transaminase
MEVPFLDLKAQYESIKSETGPAIADVLESCAFALGPYVEEFEKNFADMTQTEYCAGANSGTSALHLALLACGVGPGDEVILPAHTFVATAWAISYCGAKPVFADIHPEYYTLDSEIIEEKITDKTKAIVPVHLYGQPADMNPIMQIAQRHGLKVIEDAAQSHSAEYKGRRAGSIGHAACFSFYPGKNLGAYGEGGAVVTSDEKIIEKVHLLRNHGQPEKYIHTEIGYNYRMEGIQGAVLNVKLAHLEEWNNKRRNAADNYRKYLNNVGEVEAPAQADYAKHIYHLFELKTPSEEMRERLRKFLGERGIQTGLHYPIPVHLQRAYSHLGHRPGDFSVAEAAAKQLLSLPMFPEITCEQVEYVVDCIKEFFGK